MAFAFQGIGLLAAAAAGLYVLCQRYDPNRPHARWVRHGVLGLVMLTAWNLLPGPNVGVNPLSAGVAGALGLPGVAAMVVVNLIK